MSEKITEKIKDLEDRLAHTQIHKGTQKAINYTKAQIAKLRNQLVTIASSKTGGGGGYVVKKSGDARVAFIGFPSVGKSSLLNLLTRGHTESKVAHYDFTTLTAVPGMMDIEDAKVQLIDLPGIILGAATGRGKGREILGAARTAELVLIIVCYKNDGLIDFSDLTHIRKELFNAGIRLNERPPKIQVKKSNRGGIGFSYVGPQVMDAEEVRGIMYEMGYRNASIYFYQDNVTGDQLIDHVMDNRIYTKEFVVINKSDLDNQTITDEQISESIGHTNWTKISALKEEKIDALRHIIFKQLNLIRVYLKPPGEEADLEEPLILHKGDTIKELCLKIHKNILKDYRYCLIWGKSAKHDGQKYIKMTHGLLDKDIVSIYVKR